eukprot:TRINITY_DN5888_c0_g1_i1.p1 TRINITY_DN5888_c0_g1~~TRINITY_DN5888_c0_g1_i1.p1  ORF type:complete len:202 (+),score=1.12 TRINITY_DN5888_c0_g1_i1:29-634(+)
MDRARERLLMNDPDVKIRRYDGLNKVSHQLWFRILHELFFPGCAFLVSAAFFIPALYITVRHLHTECEHPLGPWLLVTAIFLALQALFFFIKMCYGCNRALKPIEKLEQEERDAAFEDPVTLCNITYYCYVCFYLVFWLAWHILGTVWASRSTATEYCPSELYNMVWASVISFWVVLLAIVTLFYTCVYAICCYVCCISDE